MLSEFLFRLFSASLMARHFASYLAMAASPFLSNLQILFPPSSNVVRSTTHWLTLLRNGTIDKAVGFANFYQLRHILKNPILCSTSSEPDLSGLLALLLLFITHIFIRYVVTL
ncbi:hypothetical protein ACB098_11G175100 [Castanea mollissima]